MVRILQYLSHLGGGKGVASNVANGSSSKKNDGNECGEHDDIAVG